MTALTVLKPETATGVIAGYASLFGVADQAGDRVHAGAFAGSLARRPAAEIRMLFQHLPEEPVGRWDSVAEDSRGLFVRGRLNLDVQRGRELWALITAGGLDGLSIGFRTRKAARGPGGGRILIDLDLWEVSIVTFPLHRGARLAPPDGAALARMAARALRRSAQTLQT